MLEVFSYLASKSNLLLFNDPPKYLRYESEFKAYDWRTEKEKWGAWHKKNFSTRHQKECFDVNYNTNEVGARSDFSFSKLKDNKNIVLLGDSFAEGLGVESKKIFPTILSKNYKLTLNFGSGGNFGTVQAYILYKELAKKFPHDEVIYMFLPANDFHDNDFNYYKKFGFEKRYRPYFKKKLDGTFDIFYPKDSVQKNDFPYKNETKGFLNKLKKILQDYTWTYNFLKSVKYIFQKNNNPNLIQTENFGYFFNKDTEVDGTIYFLIKLFEEVDPSYEKSLIIIPTRKDLQNILLKEKSYQNLRWYNQIKNLSEVYNVKIIDLALDQEENINSSYIKNGIKNWFLQCDGHWNSIGHMHSKNMFLLRKNY